MTPSGLQQVHLALSQDPCISIATSGPLNIATLLSTSEGHPHYDSIEFLQMTPTSFPHISSTPLSLAFDTWFIDGSSTNTDNQKKAGYAIVNQSKVIEANPLPPGTSSQRAELIALTRALTLAKDKITNIYTDSKYTFSILHSHASIWQEWCFIPTQGTPIINAPLILKLLEAAQLPKQAAVIHCRGHQSSTDPIAQGNAFADSQAKLAAQGPCPSHLLPLVPNSLPQPNYTPEQLQLLHKPGYTQNTQGWIFQGSKLVLPHQQASDIITNLHNCFYIGSQALHKLLAPIVTHPSLKAIILKTTQTCDLCARTSPQGCMAPPSFPTHQFLGHTPG
ncbi:uncharacterized protein LOC134473773 [Cavia porcellus]|uniref:uncharacterized protein LOC134473773 n=1 Tax=Cavia porcellus TaxID=10141 RepID=UPI002FE2D63F